MNDKKQKLLRITFIAIVCLFCILRLAGISILIAVLYLAVDKKVSKKSFEDLGLKRSALFGDIKKYWWLIILPTVSGLIAIGLSTLSVPEFYRHVLERTQPMLKTFFRNCNHFSIFCSSALFCGSDNRYYI